MGTCWCGADDRFTHAHYEGTALVRVPAVNPGTLGPAAPVYYPFWRPWCAACADAAAKAGLFLFGAHCLHQTFPVNPV